jgi:hypothetical protein
MVRLQCRRATLLATTLLRQQPIASFSYLINIHEVHEQESVHVASYIRIYADRETIQARSAGPSFLAGYGRIICFVMCIRST